MADIMIHTSGDPIQWSSEIHAGGVLEHDPYFTFRLTATRENHEKAEEITIFVSPEQLIQIREGISEQFAALEEADWAALDSVEVPE